MNESLKGGIIASGPAFAELEGRAKMFVDQVGAPDSKTSVMSILLTGESGCGKTAAAAVRKHCRANCTRVPTAAAPHCYG